MRIAIYYNLPFSGAKRTVYEHVKGLKELGHSVDVFTSDTGSDIFSPGLIADNEYKYQYKQRVVNLPFLRRLSNDLSDFYLLKTLHKKIASDIDSKQYDIILLHSDRLTQAPFLSQFLKTKNVYFCLEPLKIAYEYGLRFQDHHSTINKLYESWNRYMRKKIDRENARAANITFAISNFDRELMIQAFDLYPKVSYLGVDTTLFKKKQIKKKNQVLFVGQKLQLNGYNYALEAIKLIPKEIRPELQVLSISENKGKRLTDKDLVTMYNESIVTLCLSNLDTFGLVALESLACEVPVIAFNVAGYRETMIHDKTGYLVDFDAQEIADKVMLYLKDPKLATSMGQHGRKWVEKEWTWKKKSVELERLLLEVIKKK